MRRFLQAQVQAIAAYCAFRLCEESLFKKEALPGKSRAAVRHGEGRVITLLI